jgi:hypothetical protein
MASATNYKQLKEDFVSNLSGGSVIEISQVLAVPTVCTPSRADAAQFTDKETI